MNRPQTNHSAGGFVMFHNFILITANDEMMI